MKNGFGVINATLQAKFKDNGNTVKKVLSSSFLSVYAVFSKKISGDVFEISSTFNLTVKHLLLFAEFKPSSKFGDGD